MYNIKVYLCIITMLEIIHETNFQIPLQNEQGHRDIIHHYNIIKIPYVLLKQHQFNLDSVATHTVHPSKNTSILQILTLVYSIYSIYIVCIVYIQDLIISYRGGYTLKYILERESIFLESVRGNSSQKGELLSENCNKFQRKIPTFSMFLRCFQFYIDAIQSKVFILIKHL